MEDCFVKRRNLGQYLCRKLPQLLKRMIWTPDNFRIPEVSKSSLTFFQDAIFAEQDRIYLFPPFVKLEFIPTEAAYEITPLAHMHIHDGLYIFRAHVQENMCMHKRMFSHRGRSGRLLPIDVANQYVASRDENGLLMGLKLALLHTEKLAWSTGETATTSPIYIVLEDPKDVDLLGEIEDATFVKSLVGIVDVEIKDAPSVSNTASLIVVDIEVQCDNVPVIGLVAADFLVYAADGITPVTISGVTESAVKPGRYSITSAAAFATGQLLTLRKADELTINGYEHEEPFTIAIP